MPYTIEKIISLIKVEEWIDLMKNDYLEGWLDGQEEPVNCRAPEMDERLQDLENILLARDHLMENLYHSDKEAECLANPGANYIGRTIVGHLLWGMRDTNYAQVNAIRKQMLTALRAILAYGFDVNKEYYMVGNVKINICTPLAELFNEYSYSGWFEQYLKWIKKYGADLSIRELTGPDGKIIDMSQIVPHCPLSKKMRSMLFW